MSNGRELEEDGVARPEFTSWVKTRRRRNRYETGEDRIDLVTYRSAMSSEALFRARALSRISLRLMGLVERAAED